MAPRKIGRRGATGALAAVWGLVVLVVFVSILFSLGGNVVQLQRNAATNQSAGGYVTADAMLNLTTSATSFSQPLGLLVGAAVLLLVLVVVVGLVIKAFKSGDFGG